MPTATPTPRYGQTCARSPSMMSASCSPGNEAADAEVLNRELVLAVRREVVAGDDAAARAEGHAVEALVLRGVARRQIGGLGRRLPVADRHAGDARRRRRVRLEQRRRDRQRPGDVVEAVGRIVGRQQRGGVDLQVEQIADGVGVLGAVQSMQDDRARSRSVRRRRDRSPPRASRAAPRIPASGGRGMSGGGMTPARSLRITFSHSSAWSPTFARSSPCSERFAVFSRSL